MQLHRYRFRLRTLGPIRFPVFPGPALRGAIGDQRDLYAALLRPSATLPQKRFGDPPRPFVMRPRFGAGDYGAGSALELDVTLAGAAAAHFPTLLRGLARVGEQGVGADRHAAPDAGRFHIERVDAIGPDGCRTVVTPDGWLRPGTLPWRLPQDLAGPPGAWTGEVTLAFRTPTLVRRGDDPRGTLELHGIVDDMVRRISLLAQAYGGGPVYGRHEELAMTDAATAASIEDAAARWVEVPRFSRTQRQPMAFGGWMGWVRYRGVSAACLPLLRAAELLHAGKHTAFGFGAVEAVGSVRMERCSGERGGTS